MTRRIDLRRVAQYGVVVVVAVTLNFLLPRLMPGNPLALIAGVDVGMLTPDQRAEIVARVGLDAPMWVQYLRYWGDIFTGDFGFSFRSSRPIVEMIWERLPWTLLITGLSLVVSAVVGVLLGALSAWRRGTKGDLSLLSGMISVESLPSFWLGMVLISLFAVQWGLLPSFGAVTPASDLEGWAHVWDIVSHAILPVTALAIVGTPGVYMTMRYSMLETLGEDYIRTAQSERRRRAPGTVRACRPQYHRPGDHGPGHPPWVRVRGHGDHRDSVLLSGTRPFGLRSGGRA